MSKLRRKFGPSFTGTYPRPEVPGELPDVEPTAGVKAVRPAANGTIDVDIAFVIPPHDPSAVNTLAELHAIAFPPGHGIPTDPELAITAAHPMASTSETGTSDGGEVVLTVEGAQSGLLHWKTVLSYADTSAPTDPTASAPSDPTSSAPTDPTSTAPADPTISAAADPTSDPAAPAEPTASAAVPGTPAS